ncbi:hypothetical protein BDZ91DRAFT_715074, partial [Kalaharituber pfeilii]
MSQECNKQTFPPSILKRSSKSTPAVMSSKCPVSRIREAIPVPTVGTLDPRFDLTSSPVNERQSAKNYAFLEKYRKEELEMLREQIKKTKGEEEKEKLMRILKSIEFKKQKPKNVLRRWSPSTRSGQKKRSRVKRRRIS